jgi:hypothetical protein
MADFSLPDASHADNTQKCIGEKILMFPMIVLDLSL